MPTAKKSLEAAPPSPPAIPPTLYHVSLRMQVGSLAGDAEYHVQMQRGEIESLLNGTAKVVRLPERFGRSKAAGQLADEWRFLPLSNIVEITLTDLEWPAADYIAETVT